MATASTAKGLVLYTFYPVEQFEWWEGDVLKGIYKPGLRYSVRAGNNALKAKVHQWASEGKVSIRRS